MTSSFVALSPPGQVSPRAILSERLSHVPQNLESSSSWFGVEIETPSLSRHFTLSQWVMPTKRYFIWRQFNIFVSFEALITFGAEYNYFSETGSVHALFYQLFTHPFDSLRVTTRSSAMYFYSEALKMTKRICTQYILTA